MRRCTPTCRGTWRPTSHLADFMFVWCRIISLSEGSAYETLHAYVSGAMAPYFKSFVRESGKADRSEPHKKY
jgi:hypothetical protein